MLGQQQLGALALGDLVQQAVLHDAVGLDLGHQRVVQHPHHLAVPAHHPVLALGAAGARAEFLGSQHPLGVGRVQLPGPQAGIGEEIVRPVSEDCSIWGLA